LANTYEPIIAGGSTDGGLIKIAATASPGTAIHTGPATTTWYDFVTLWAFNKDISSVTLTIEWGTTGVDNEYSIIVQPGLVAVCVLDRWEIKGNATALTVAAYASVANKIFIKPSILRVKVL